MFVGGTEILFSVVPHVFNRMRESDQLGKGYRVIEPQSETDWENYYDLRWRILRAPWNEPRGSEQDEREDESIHLMICDASQAPVAVGRVHFVSRDEAQIRFMAVEPHFAGRGLGSQILSELESRAQSRGAKRFILNARTGAAPFYLKHGYTVIGPADTLFGAVEHMRMEKVVTPQARVDRHR